VTEYLSFIIEQLEHLNGRGRFYWDGTGIAK
jgi:hypothetical protein